LYCERRRYEKKENATLSPQQPAALDEADVKPAALPVVIQYTALCLRERVSREKPTGHTTLREKISGLSLC
jgi:hypothetical protein